ncbi:MAG: DUF4399 domain-containing protein [Woeseiaceae bacterium]|nr:DUF4399 domain-containing protein [Woeseiaceae bacterium]
MKNRILPVLACSFAIAACGEKPAEESAADAAAEPATPAPVAAALPRTPSVGDARVFFISPGDGDTVTSPVRIEFGIEGMAVAPAGDNTPHSGHHHLLINTALPEMGLPIPADANHVHFGDGSTSTEIALEPGEHTLQMLLGDHLHIPHDPPLFSRKITIYVESGAL